jgi:opacity protein-like surface antigen
MKTLLALVAVLIAFSAQAMAQDVPQTQMPKVKPGVNLMGEKYVDPRVKDYRKAVDREYDAALKKIPDQKKANSDPWAGVRSGEPGKK